MKMHRLRRTQLERAPEMRILELKAFKHKFGEVKMIRENGAVLVSGEIIQNGKYLMTFEEIERMITKSYERYYRGFQLTRKY